MYVWLLWEEELKVIVASMCDNTSPTILGAEEFGYLMFRQFCCFSGAGAWFDKCTWMNDTFITSRVSMVDLGVDSPYHIISHHFDYELSFGYCLGSEFLRYLRFISPPSWMLSYRGKSENYPTPPRRNKTKAPSTMTVAWVFQMMSRRISSWLYCYLCILTLSSKFFLISYSSTMAK